MAEFKDQGEGHYYHEKKKKRDRPTGLCIVPGVPNAITGVFYITGPFIAETILLCNGDSVSADGQIFDGMMPLTCPFTLAPGALVALTLIYLPFFHAIGWSSSSPFARITLGGWIP